MAITNAQQFKQLVNPPMKGKKRPGYRGEAAAASDRAGDRNAGRSDTGSPSGRGDGPGSSGPSRNPMAQFGFTPEEKAAVKASAQSELARRNELIGFGDKTGLSSLPSFLGKGLNLFKVKRGNEFAQGFKRSLTPTPFQANTDSNDFIGDTPLWAQLGFNSEAEYLASLQAQENMDQEPEGEEGLLRRFRAEGGIMNTDVVGGEMDFESARQMYGLGKLVKKVTRSVKKIAKSPLGKAALLGVGAFGLPGGAFGMKGFLPQAFKTSASKFLFGLPSGNPIVPPTKGIFGVGGELALGKGKLGIGSLISGASLVSGLLTPEQEEEAQQIADNTGFSIEEARNSILARARDDYKMDFRARGFRAEGGPAEGKEPVAKKTMPLLDMDGKEMDLRAEGGFVPIGRMEKADDVPARLSKNEFVFTADAVRNAGEGDVDKGAEVMYNMMKNLESGGEVSEESQGLEGARKMFQTSQRLEEVL